MVKGAMKQKGVNYLPLKYGTHVYMHAHICTHIGRKGWEIRPKLNVLSSTKEKDLTDSEEAALWRGMRGFLPSSYHMLWTDEITCSLEALPAFPPPPPAPQIRAQIPSFPVLPQMYKQIFALSALLCCLMLDSTYGPVPAALDFEVTGG